jgi:hypothetical protein
VLPMLCRAYELYSVVEPDPHGSGSFGNLDPHPHQVDKPDPDPHPDPLLLKIRILILIKVISRIRNTVSKYVNFSKTFNEKSTKFPQKAGSRSASSEKSDPDPHLHQ